MAKLSVNIIVSSWSLGLHFKFHELAWKMKQLGMRVGQFDLIAHRIGKLKNENNYNYMSNFIDFGSLKPNDIWIPFCWAAGPSPQGRWAKHPQYPWSHISWEWWLKRTAAEEGGKGQVLETCMHRAIMIAKLQDRYRNLRNEKLNHIILALAFYLDPCFF